MDSGVLTNEVDLDDPDDLLFVFRELELGAIEMDSLRSILGRNINWRGTRRSGEHFFAKKLIGYDSTNRFTRSLAAGALADRIPTPELLCHHQERSVLVFSVPRGAEQVRGWFGGREPDEQSLVECGEVLGKLHALNLTAEVGDTRFVAPPLSDLKAISVDVYNHLTAGQIEAFRLLHSDPTVSASVAKLRAREDAALEHYTPVHGDIRLDQFLISEEGIFVIDFEEFRRGDPARDLGSLVGSILHSAILSIPERLKDERSIGVATTDREIMEAGSSSLERVAQVISEIWARYQGSRGDTSADPDLPVRATAFAGWHMFDRLLASSEAASMLSPGILAAAGIGRSLLSDPDGHAESIGLTGGKP